jgi:phenylalanyl-tRNA synthetase beta chain
MKVLRSWLCEFAPFEAPIEVMADELSDLGLAVEAIEQVGGGLEGVVVAEVLDLRPHPEADRIQLVDVDAGDGEPRQICCGAFNMSVGDKVPLATTGTELPDGMRIERRKMRGQWSEGMLCAPDELGLGDDHGGIWLLSPDAVPGTPLVEAMGLRADVLFDLEVNPNRPDAMAVAGVARDLAARLKVPFSIPSPRFPTAERRCDEVTAVEILDPDLCGRFAVRALEGVTVGESPMWMQQRLLAAGMRPINAVVDVSNYVMLELGQPNHTYDADLVPGGVLATRWARDDETLLTLDGVERQLRVDDGVIVDRDDRVIGLAGVMGGASTEISSATTRVLLEMAWWQPMAVARTSSRLGLRSEASARFERGTDPEMAELASARFCELLAASGAVALSGMVDARGDLPPRDPVRVRTTRVNDVLGTDLDEAAIEAALAPIGFTCTSAPDAEGQLDVLVPTFRPDTTLEIDVIEEIARHRSYSSITPRVPKALAGRLDARQRDRRIVRELLVGAGVDEAMPMPFLAPGDLGRAGAPTDAVVVTNPLDAKESVLRTSLRPGLLKALAYNASHRTPEVRLFELGRVFHRPSAGGSKVLPDEPEHLAVALAGSDAHEAVRVLRILVDAVDATATLQAAEAPGLHATRCASVLVGGASAGWVGEIDPQVAEAFGVPVRVGWIELALDTLLDPSRGPRQARAVSTYPSSDLDLAFAVEESVPAAEVEAAVRAGAGELLVDCRLFDVYRGPGVAQGRRSLAFRLRLQASDRTLTDAEVGRRREEIVGAVSEATGATLRA